jgi:putative two-component system response regulator
MDKDLLKLISMSQNIKILYVEDNEEARQSTLLMLEEFFDDITTAVDGEDGYEKFENGSYDMIITDINMPKMTGIELSAKIRETDQDIPILVISAHNEVDFFLQTIKIGIEGYLLKPIDLTQFMHTISKVVKYIHRYKENISYKDSLEEKVKEEIAKELALMQELEDTQKDFVFRMGTLGEMKSKETGNHVKRVAHYSRLLALKYGMSEEEADLLYTVSPMHDIGKIGIPDSILKKPDVLSDEEREVMNTHASIGYEVFKDSDKKILKSAGIVSYTHHEKYDGSGYPNGLKGEEIHIYGRITAVADVFDALGSDRVYKKAWELDRIIDMFKSERGKHFDPQIIDIFLDNIDEFLVIRDRFVDVK